METKKLLNGINLHYADKQNVRYCGQLPSSCTFSPVSYWHQSCSINHGSCMNKKTVISRWSAKVMVRWPCWLVSKSVLELVRLVSTHQGSHASWKVLDFFPKISRNWEVLENEFGPGKSLKLKFKVLESSGNYPQFNLTNMLFIYKINSTQLCLHSVDSLFLTYGTNQRNICDWLIDCWAMTKSWENFLEVLEKSWNLS